MEIWFLLMIVFSLCMLVYLIITIINNCKINEQLDNNIANNPESRGSDLIPKNIYQLISDKNNISKEFKKNIEYIKKLNTNWTHNLYDDNDIIEYIKKNYPQNILDVYNRINPKYGAARADFFRYLLMYNEGGVYLDIKSAMKVSLDKILKPDDEYILSHWECPCQYNLLDSEYGEFQQWHIICKPKHPFLKEVIDNVVKNIQNYDVDRDGVGKKGVLKVTGPIVYTKSIIPILSLYKYTIYETQLYIGLIYNNISKSHINSFSKKHYSKIDEPIIL